MTAPTTTTRSWRQLVLDADPDFLRESLRPVVYEFAGGRKFTQPADPYQGGMPGAILSEDGNPILSEDGRTILAET